MSHFSQSTRIFCSVASCPHLFDCAAHNISKSSFFFSSKSFFFSNLGRFFADDSELRTICGSPLYVAPEILDIGMNLETVSRKLLIS